MKVFFGFDFGVFFGYPLLWSFVCHIRSCDFWFFGGFGFVWTAPMDSRRPTNFFGSFFLVVLGRLAPVTVFPSISGISIFGFFCRVLFLLDASSDSALRDFSRSFDVCFFLSLCRLCGGCFAIFGGQIFVFCFGLVCFLFCLCGSVFCCVRSSCGSLLSLFFSSLSFWGSAGAGDSLLSPLLPLVC